MKKGLWIKVLVIILLIVYILNFGAGIIEFIPDNLPIVGNIDEGAAGAVIALLLKSAVKK